MNINNLPPNILQELMAQLEQLSDMGRLRDEQIEETEEANAEKNDTASLALLSINDPEDLLLSKQFSNDEKVLQEFTLYQVFVKNTFPNINLEDENPTNLWHEYLDTLYEGYTPTGGVCGKKLTSMDVAYQCFDCQTDTTCIICKDCFEDHETKHKGHRFKIKHHVSGMCDCGDTEAWKPQGNCKKHSGFVSEDDRMNSEMKRKFIKEFKRCLYYFVQFVERNKESRKLLDFAGKKLVELIQGVMSQVQKHPSLGLLVGKAFCEPYQLDFGPDACLSIFQSNPSEIEHTEDLDDGSTVLRSLLRVNIYLSKSSGTHLNEFFMGLFIDYNFKEHLAVEYVRMINFQVDWKKLTRGYGAGTEKYTSQLMDISIQILTSEQLAIKAIKKAGLGNMFFGMKNIIERYVKNGKIEVEDFFINHIWQNFCYVAQRRTAIEELFSDSVALSQLFNVLEVVIQNQPRFVYKEKASNAELREEPVVQTAYFELRIIRDFIDLVVPLFCKNLSSIFPCYLNFMKELSKRLLKTSMDFATQKTQYYEDMKKEETTIKGPISSPTCLIFHKVFTACLVPYLYIHQKDVGDEQQLEIKDFSFDRLSEFSSKVLGDESEQKHFWNRLLVDVSGCVGFMKEMEKKIWGMYGEINLKYKWLYYNFDLHIIDVIALQFCALQLPETFSKVMWQNFFSCKGWDKLAEFKINEALSLYHPEKDDIRINGIFRCIEDFFKYQIEISTNQHFILGILETFVQDIQKSYESQKFSCTSTEGIKSARKRHLFSLLFASKPMGVKEFLDSIKNEIQDKEVFEELMQTKTVLNMEKRTIAVKSECVQESLNKIFKSIEDLYYGTGIGLKLAIEEAPQINVGWYNSNKSQKYTEEVMNKQSNSVLKYIQSKGITENNLKSILELSQFYFYTPSFTTESKKIKIKFDDFLQEFIEGTDEESLKLMETNNNLQHLFALILMYVDKMESSQTLEPLLGIFIEKLSETAKSAAPFNLFKLILRTRIKSTFLGDHQNQEDKKKKMADLAAKKREMLRLKTQNKQNKLAAFMENVQVTDELENPSEKQITETTYEIECVVSHEKLQNKDCYLKLGYCSFLNITESKKLSTLKQIRESIIMNQGQDYKRECAKLESVISEQYLVSMNSDKMCFTECGHNIDKEELLKSDSNTRIYEDDERPCPLCKTQSNVRIPVIRDFLKRINQLPEKADNLEVQAVCKAIFENSFCQLLASARKSINLKTLDEFYKDYSQQIDDFRNQILVVILKQTEILSEIGDTTRGSKPNQSLFRIQFEIKGTLFLSESIVESIDIIDDLGIANFFQKSFDLYSHLSRLLCLIVNQEGLYESKPNAEEYKQQLEKPNRILLQVILSPTFVFKTFERKCLEILMGLVLNSQDLLLLRKTLAITSLVFWKLLRLLSDNNPRADEYEITFLRKCLVFNLLFSNQKHENSCFDYNAYCEEFNVECPEKHEAEKLHILKILAQNFGINPNEIDGQVSESLELYREVYGQFTNDIATTWDNLSISDEDEESKMCSENKDDKMEQEDEKAGENKLRSDSASILELTLEKIKDKSLNDIKELMDKNTLADFVIQTFQTQTEGRRFSLISLEPDFGKLYQNYIYQKCQKCGNSADKQDFALCLLCGYLCCVRKCGSSSLAIGKVPGNLCQHAVLHHSGNSAYLNIMKGSHILYSNKRLFEFNGIYVDSYGMVVTDYEYRQTDMQNFKLNQEALKAIRQKIIEYKQAAHIVQTTITENKMYQQMYF